MKQGQVKCVSLASRQAQLRLTSDNVRIWREILKSKKKFASNSFAFILIKPPDPKPVPEPSPKTCSSSSSILFDNDLCSLTTTWTGGFRPCFNFNEETDVEFLLLKPVTRIKVLWSSALGKCYAGLCNPQSLEGQKREQKVRLSMPT